MSTSIFDINRKYSVNAEYFSDINTQEKAYWLGFIWADGSINKTAPRCSGANRFTLTQVETEANHLQAFVQAIECNYTPVLKDLNRPLGKRTLALDVNSRPFCMALENLGYGTKEHRTDIPAMPRELLHHFIRGYFDGDGCLSVYKQNDTRRQEWSLTGNEKLLVQIQNILNQETSVSKNVALKRYKRTTKAVGLRYGRRSDIPALYDYMYDGATVYMKSKHQKFEMFFQREHEAQNS